MACLVEGVEALTSSSSCGSGIDPAPVRCLEHATQVNMLDSQKFQRNKKRTLWLSNILFPLWTNHSSYMEIHRNRIKKYNRREEEGELVLFYCF